ncbi:GerAB/ArcD/ProY family transporter [Peribacillus sp. NPDC097295]|uniref:GerAB/ArcD/ProY family transporter n=1 Tax=Peribacillus sp. NPDC097295 TaxID=3364402 RepID=UPI00381C21C6
MEKAKISAIQLFVLMVLFEVGTAQLVPLGKDAKQDAWIVVLLAMLGGCLLFFIYYALYKYYPEKQLTGFIEDILGNVLGKIVVFLYILYFMYLASIVLRDFGETLLTFAYAKTPLFCANAMMILIVVYALRKGIEVVARTGELLFIIAFVLAIIFIILVIVSGFVHMSFLRPVLESGGKEVLKTAFTKTIFFPFGEIVVFTMIFPYVSKPDKLMKATLSAIILSGTFLTLIMVMNLTVLGFDYVGRSQYPLLTVVQSIELAGFIERLDVYFLVELMIGGFFKLGLFLYAAVTGVSTLFNFKEPSQLVYPLGIVVLMSSILIASSYAEHSKEVIEWLPMYVHFPFQVLLPIILLIIAYFKNRKKNRTSKPYGA